jgi:3-deoxy-D-manno-octulosonic-acid transferase
MSGWLISNIYTAFAYPALRLATRLMAVAGNAKIRAGLLMRQPTADGRAPWEQGEPEQRPIWIHCASGEFEYAKPVITELKRRDPGQKILLTYFSPSVRGAVAKFPGIDMHCPVPWDRAADINALIRHHRPRALLIARTDTWPMMLAQAKRNNIPTLLFSATLPDAAGRLRPLVRPLTKWVFSQLTAIYCVSRQDRERFEALGLADRTMVAGDTRFDQVLTRLSTPQPLKSFLAPGNTAIAASPLLVAGSTWSEDEAHLVPMMARFKGKIRFIIAPHEPSAEHLQELEARLGSSGLLSVRYSRSEDWPADKQVLIIDQVGILAELYTRGQFAFVGGSFRKTVHSVMEPLGAGCLTFVGPLHWNNREALEFKSIPLPHAPLTCVTEVRDADEWSQRIQEGLDLLASQRPWSDYIRGQIQSRSGRSALVADWALRERR